MSCKGYMALEYALMGGSFTFKANDFSFGVVALEIIIGKNNMKYRSNKNCNIFQLKIV